MTPQEVRTLLDGIVTELDAAASFAGAIDPALIPAIVIGRAVAKQIPALGETVASWISGNPPSQAELDQLQADLKALSDPNAP